MAAPALAARPAAAAEPARRGTGYTALAVTWAAPDATPAIEVRTLTAAGWSGWQPLAVDPEGPPTGRGGTRLRWVPGLEDAQVRTAGPAPDDLQLHLIRAEAEPAPPTPPRPDAAGPQLVAYAGAGPGAPPILGRAAWGADPKLMTWPPEYASTLKALTIHHSDDGSPNGYAKSDVPRILRAIYRYNAVTRGWGDIGYNFLVDRFGRIWEGRAGGVDRPVVGAHAGGFNRATCGIAVLGNYNAAPYSDPARAAVAALGAWKLGAYGRDPHGTVTIVSTGGGTSRFPKGQKVTLPVVMGHRDTGNTDCPGGAGYAQLPSLRDQISDKLRDPR
ncbi:MAG: N-acetylmuramoyl-L-alanine amidase [Mycobacteriales bacterium]